MQRLVGLVYLRRNYLAMNLKATLKKFLFSTGTAPLFKINCPHCNSCRIDDLETKLSTIKSKLPEYQLILDQCNIFMLLLKPVILLT